MQLVVPWADSILCDLAPLYISPATGRIGERTDQGTSNEMLSVHSRVPTGLPCPAASHEGLEADKLDRASSSTSSARSLDSTVQGGEPDIVQAAGACEMEKSKSYDFNLCGILTEGYDTRCSAVDICDVLTAGRNPVAAHDGA